jgi:trigger factor
MQVAVETTEGLERRMTVEVPEETLASEVDSRLRGMVGQVRVPGFRPGKVPMKVLSRRFGRQVRDEVVGETLRSTFLEAVEQESLRPAGGPVIDPVNAEVGQGLSYTAVFEVYPEIELADLGTMTLNRPAATVLDADVDGMYEVLRRQRKTWESVDRAAATGDQVTIDFVGRIDGEEFEGGTATAFPLELGQGRMLPGFEDGLVGASASEERELKVSFPEDYHVEALKGKPAAFTVKLEKVEAPKMPEIDEEFIRAFGVEDGTPESFRVEVRSNMERELENALKARTRDGVMEALLAGNTVEVPKALVSEESERLFQSRRQELANMGIDPEQLQIQPQIFEGDAQRRVQLGLLLAEVIKVSGLKPDPMAVREQVERIAGSYEDPAQVINWFYGEAGRLGDIESQVLEEAAIESILEKGTVTEESLSFDDLMKPGQTT